MKRRRDDCGISPLESRSRRSIRSKCPQLIEECFDQILDTTSAIDDPFEQAFFFMVQLPYLQPFDDVNKRVSADCREYPADQKQSLSAFIHRRTAFHLHRGGYSACMS